MGTIEKIDPDEFEVSLTTIKRNYVIIHQLSVTLEQEFNNMHQAMFGVETKPTEIEEKISGIRNCDRGEIDDRLLAILSNLKEMMEFETHKIKECAGPEEGEWKKHSRETKEQPLLQEIS